MSPNQGPEALDERSNHNSDYQTVSKLENLIIESSDPTRRIQRAQEHKIPTPLSQKIIHRTVHMQGIQHRPSIQITLKSPLIFLLFTESSKISRAPTPPPANCRTTAGPPPGGPTPPPGCRTFTWPTTTVLPTSVTKSWSLRPPSPVDNDLSDLRRPLTMVLSTSFSDCGPFDLRRQTTVCSTTATCQLRSL
ncbi:hypothetical protein M5K25_002970 [Dendrobium thyrsiflorum]|uniref:Uncharacterized protein n=1 Tax=Dendrobium thyrsiflorum TaxID=117978 RepID=A0ABD0VNW6_DENTH